jgi:hypothetical protein
MIYSLGAPYRAGDRLMEKHRKHPRVRTLKSGKIIFNQKSSILDCTIRNLSKQGACLEMPSTLGIPPYFELLFVADRTVRSCDVAWITETRMGVSFR